ncbi:MAG: CBS domain-containing protein [Planctomycetota bacterium]
MIILYWMTPDPVVVTEQDTLLDAALLLRKHGIRRLPVVRDDDHLCGIIGRWDLYSWVDRDHLAGELAAEARDTLSARTVAEAMTEDPKTCDAYDHLEEVSERMRTEKVGAYPVLHRGHLVGIVSETDLLRAIAELAYHRSDGKRITVRIAQEEAAGLLYDVVDRSRRHGLELLAILTHPILDESALMATLRVRGRSVDKFLSALWDAGYKVVDVS